MRRVPWFSALGAAIAVLMATMAVAAEPDMIQGAPIITVLPLDAIPAIDNPKYLPVAEADSFMRPDEPILGITDGKIAKAYSTWQLNHHEIVNDTLGNLPLAVTW